MSNTLQDKVAIVTGGSRGMGAAHARGIVAEGASVMIADVLVDEGKALARELGARAAFVELDVREEMAWTHAIDEAVTRFGGLDVLVNNAGVSDIAPLVDTSLEAYRRVIDINQVGVFLGMRSAVVPMTRRGGGSIINVSSAAGLWASPLIIAYVASKFAVRGMTKSAALELGRVGIRVNSVHPGYIRTPMLENADPELRNSQAAVEGAVALGRIADPREVTEVVLFLASDASRYCTGAEFVVDGGLTSGTFPAGFAELAEEAIRKRL